MGIIGNTFQVFLSGETQHIHPEVGQHSASYELSYNLDNAKLVDLGIVDGELHDECPGPVVYPVVDLQGSNPLVQGVDVPPQPELVTPAGVVGEVGLVIGGLPLLGSAVLKLLHLGAVNIQQRNPVLAVRSEHSNNSQRSNKKLSLRSILQNVWGF